MNKIVFFVLSLVLISCETPINSLEKKKNELSRTS